MDAKDRAEAWRAALTAMLAASGSALGGQADPAANLVDEVHRTVAQFRPKPCRAGRARVAAERSMGRDDPGMVAMLRLMEGATGQRARTLA